MEAYVNGVSTRKVDRLVTQMGLEGIDKSAVSRINEGLDDRVKHFTDRRLDGEYAYVYLDATFPKVREDHQVQSTALVVAMGVRMDGCREILGIDMGASETEAFWTEFLRSLVDRGLRGVQLVISDAHRGLKNAISAVFDSAIWQRCQVHFMRDIITHVPKSAQEEATSEIRSIFLQPTRKQAEEQLDRIVTKFAADKRFIKVADLLEEAAPDLLAHMEFPQAHWKRIRTTNPLERLNKELRRRTNVVGIFPNREAVIRLCGAFLLEQNENWMAAKHYFSEESMALLNQRP
jgi:putative transposase